MHIGLTDLATEGHFVWGTDFSGLDYTNWNDGEPNNSGGNEECAHLYGIRGLKWNDLSCTKTAPPNGGELHALCQKSS